MTAKKAEQQSAHALLSASSASTWLNCPPSARLGETLPDTASEYAAEGSLAHEAAELVMRKYLEPMGVKAFNNRLKKLKENPLWQDEMLEHANTYKEFISELYMKYADKPTAGIEKRLDFSHIAPEGFGTSDLVMIGGDTLCVVDYKYGKGVSVSAENNPQMMLYALGAHALYGLFYQIEKVVMAIVQPRIGSITSFEMPLESLLAWGEYAKPIAQIAFEGKGEFKDGDHCRFCRARSLCRARADANLALERDYQKKLPELLTLEEISEIIARVDGLVKWANEVKDFALTEALRGSEIPGWKLVEGRAGNRNFVDVDTAFGVLKASGIDEALLYERRPISLPDTEKLLGKKKFGDLLGEHIVRPPGKPALVPESDPREPYVKTSVLDDIQQIKESEGK